MKAVSGSLKLNSQLIVLLAGALLLATELAAPLMNALEPAGERLALLYSTNHLFDATTGDSPTLSRQRVASAGLTNVIAAATPAAPGRPTPFPQALQLEWASSAPAPQAKATSIRIVDLLANRTRN